MCVYIHLNVTNPYFWILDGKYKIKRIKSPMLTTFWFLATIVTMLSFTATLMTMSSSRFPTTLTTGKSFSRIPLWKTEEKLKKKKMRTEFRRLQKWNVNHHHNQ